MFYSSDLQLRIAAQRDRKYLCKRRKRRYEVQSQGRLDSTGNTDVTILHTVMLPILYGRAQTQAIVLKLRHL